MNLLLLDLILTELLLRHPNRGQVPPRHCEGAPGDCGNLLDGESLSLNEIAAVATAPSQ